MAVKVTRGRFSVCLQQGQSMEDALKELDRLEEAHRLTMDDGFYFWTFIMSILFISGAYATGGWLGGLWMFAVLGCIAYEVDLLLRRYPSRSPR